MSNFFAGLSKLTTFVIEGPFFIVAFSSTNRVVIGFYFGFKSSFLIVLSFVASILPARNEARLTIREVLAYE